MLRNRELMRVFIDVELVEGLGSGMRRILEAYDRSVFEITPSFIVVTFPYAQDFERESAGRMSEEVSEEVSGVLSKADLEKVKPILEYLKSHDSITPHRAQALTGKTAKTTWRYLKLLRERGIIASSGCTSAIKYHLK